MGSRIQVQSVLKRAFLDDIVQAAIKSSTPLLQSFRNAKQSVNSPTFSKGRIVIHQSGSGQSGAYQAGFSGAQWTQENVYGMLQEYIDLYYAVISQNEQVGTPLPTDDGNEANTNAIFAAMRVDDSLQGVTSQSGDWTGLNVPSLGGVPAS